MAQIPYRANLSATLFPMTLAKAGRSVISPGADQNFDKRVDPTANQGSVGIPQAIYLENVLPTPEGYQSVGFVPCTDIAVAPINAMAALKIATVTTTTTESGGGDFDNIDVGDQLETWTTSAFIAYIYEFMTSLGDSGEGHLSGGAPIYTEVAESTGVMTTSYRLAHINNHTEEHPAWMKKSFDKLSESAIVNASWKVLFRAAESIGGAVPKKYMDVAICTDTNGKGIRITYESVTGKLAIQTSTGGWDRLNHTEIISTDIALDYETEYIVNVVSTDNPDGSRTVNLEITDTAATPVVLTSTIGVVPSGTTKGNYCGFILDLETQPWGAGGSEGAPGDPFKPERIFYTAINFGGGTPITEETVTINSGIVAVYLAFLADGTVQWSRSLSAWEGKVVILPGTYTNATNDSEISVATVRGIGYLCIRTGGVTKIYRASLEESTDDLSFVDISTTISAGLSLGYVLDDIVGIVGSFNYLILFTATTVFWSSTTTPTDFAYSLVSGAGFELPGNIKGDIVFCKEHVAGFYLYSTKNVLFAQYTGNARYPWKFREIGGSGGFTKSTQVSGDTNSSAQLGVNNAKLIQLIAPESAELIAPEATDYLERGNTYDSFNAVTNVFTTTYLASLGITDPKIFFYLDRYIILPVVQAAGLFAYAIVYDNLLKRYGKLKITFTNILTDDSGVYFINYATGTITKLYFNINEQTLPTYKHEAVLLLGRFQLLRDRFLQIEGVELESAQNAVITTDNKQFSTFLLPSLDGKNFGTPVTLTPVINTPDLITYNAHTTGKNICIGVKGAFNLATVAFVSTVAGKR